MSEAQVFDKVVALIRPYAKNQEALSSVKLETGLLDELQVNSARLVDVVLAVEDEFGIEVEDDEAEQVATVGDVVGIITGKLAAA